MNKKADAIVIGAGIIGACTAYELARKGYKTLSIDKVASAGDGSTANSCAIVRAHYSTRDGVAMAYEGFKYWQDWENYLENVKDEKGFAKFMNTGSILIKSQGHDWRKVIKHYKDVGVPCEEWDIATLKEKVPVYDTHEHWPVNCRAGRCNWCRAAGSAARRPRTRRSASRRRLGEWSEGSGESRRPTWRT